MFYMSKLDGNEITKELVSCVHTYDYLCLSRTQKWCSEMLYSFEKVALSEEHLKIDLTEMIGSGKDFIKYQLARSYFNLKEYARAAHYLTDCESSACYFLSVYSKYMSIMKRSVENKTNLFSYIDATNLESLLSLRNELSAKYNKNQLDSFSLYVYGIVLSKLKLVDEAVSVFIEALKKRPTLWCAWLELANLVRSIETLNSVSSLVPQHWMKELFLAHCYMELGLYEETILIYMAFCNTGFSNSVYIKSQMAKCYDNLREGQKCKQTFESIRKLDPYNLDFMDIYSNILFVLEEHAQLAILAQEACEIDKYRPESCCIIGNYYSLQNEHHKAVSYFQRALKLNPSYLQAWTLMGHEFMELKNSTLAVQSYTNAIEFNPKDYRAWYGLGQTYEILKLYSYSLYYYKQAYLLRPNDSRFLVALADVYVKLEKWDEAKRCYIKAYTVGDYEGTSLCKLAKVYEKLNEPINVAIVYDQFTEDQKFQRRPNICSSELSQAYKYLANFYLKKMKLDNACDAATKCLEFPETRQEAQSILNQIAQLRNTLKEQEVVTSAYLIGAGSVDMEIGASTSDAAAAKLSNLASVAAATTLGGIGGGGGSGEQITSVLSSSLIVLDNLDTIDDTAALDSKRPDEARADSGGSEATAGASNVESINIRISSDSDLDTESYFSDFNIKRFSSKRGNGSGGDNN